MLLITIVIFILGVVGAVLAYLEGGKYKILSFVIVIISSVLGLYLYFSGQPRVTILETQPSTYTDNGMYAGYYLTSYRVNINSQDVIPELILSVVGNSNIQWTPALKVGGGTVEENTLKPGKLTIDNAAGSYFFGILSKGSANFQVTYSIQ